MKWLEVISLILLVGVTVALFIYSKRNEKKRKPSRPLVTGVVTHRNPAPQPLMTQVVEPTNASGEYGNENVQELLMQNRFQDAVLTAEYWEGKDGKHYRAWYPLHVACAKSWIEWPAMVSYQSNEKRNKAKFFEETNRFKWYPDETTNEPIWKEKKGTACFTVGQVLLTNIDNLAEYVVIEESELAKYTPH